MTEQNQVPDIAVDDQTDDPQGRHLREDTEGHMFREDADDAEGHMFRGDADDADDTEGQVMRQ